MTSRVVAAFDIGTNAVQMRMAARDDAGSVRTFFDNNIITGLGRGVDRSGRLHSEAMNRTWAALSACMERVRDSASTVVAVGTSALRDASNRSEFTSRADEILGVHVQVISGEREAELTTRGALHDLPIQTCTLVDIGGGSTEFIAVQGGAIHHATSVNIGSVRLYERFVKHDPPELAELRELDRAIDDALQQVTFAGPLVALAGTATSVGLIAKNQSADEVSSLHLRTITDDEVRDVAQRLGAMRLADRRALKGLHPDRADVIVAGSAILARTLARASASSVLLSDSGVRMGLLLEEFDRAV